MNREGAMTAGGGNVSVIIVSWNTKSQTLQCLAALEKFSPEAQTIVVDNHSDDGTVECVRDRFNNVLLVPLRDNAGYSRANNIGAAKASRKVLCFLNSDAYLEQSLDTLADGLLQNPDLGVIAPRVHFPDGRFQKTCGRELSPLSEFWFCGVDALSPLKSPWHYWRRYATASWWKRRHEVDWVSGCCLLISADWFKRLGGWDERFFAYCEDTQLCRCCRSNRKKVAYDPSVQVCHDGGASFKKAASVDRLLRKFRSTVVYLFGEEPCPEADMFQRRVRFAWMCWRRSLAFLLRIFPVSALKCKLEYVENLLEQTS